MLSTTTMKVLVALTLLGTVLIGDRFAVAQIHTYPGNAYNECFQLTTASGSLRSRNYPNTYPENFKECWLIRTAIGTVIRITIDQLQTEPYYDVVRIYDGDFVTDLPLRELSGNVYVGRITTTTNNMIVAFETSNITSDTTLYPHSGFAGDYVSLNEDTLLVVIFATTTTARFIIKEDGDHGSLLMNSDDAILNVSKDRTVKELGNQLSIDAETTPAPFVCPPGAMANYPYPGSCELYYVCKSGNYFISSCGAGQAFNPSTGFCDEAANVPGCSEPVIPLTLSISSFLKTDNILYFY